MSRKRTREYREKYWAEHDKDDYECPDCGRGRSEVKLFEVHHIDGNVGNNAMENLLGLCQSCHHDRHGIDPSTGYGHWSDEYFNEWQSGQSPLKYL